MAAFHVQARLTAPAPSVASMPFVSSPWRRRASFLTSVNHHSFTAQALNNMDFATSEALHQVPLALLQEATNNSGIEFALASGGVIALLATALSLADPEKRRQQEAASAGGNEKDAVRNYFNTAGFDRWRRIYGETDDVNTVQLDIREGHAVTVEKVLGLLRKDGLRDVTVCDAGCGTGSLTVPLVLEGAIVNASDISEAMVNEAQKRTQEAIKTLDSSKPVQMPTFQTSDLESLKGKYHTVACIDVLIHYPQDKAAGMIAHLASLATDKLIISFAPKDPLKVILKRIGEFFPGPSKATRAYLHAESDIEAALNAVGWTVRNRDMTSTKFYYSRLLEAVPLSKN